MDQTIEGLEYKASTMQNKDFEEKRDIRRVPLGEAMWLGRMVGRIRIQEISYGAKL